MSVTRFPMNGDQRWKNHLGPLAVPCQVTMRWLQLPEESDVFPDKEFLKIDVMTSDSEDDPRKLCELIVTRADLESALAQVRARRR